MPHPLTTAEPTLDEKLAYADLFFAAPSEARDILVAQGKVARPYILNHERGPDAETRADLRIIGAYAAHLIGQRAYDAGLPFSVCSTDEVRAAYLERASEGAALAPVRSTVGMAA